MNKIFVFDLDDTLIKTQHLYKFSQVKLASFIQKKLGYHAVELSFISRILDEMEDKNVELFKKEKENIFCAERYLKSCEDTYKYFCDKYDEDYTQNEIKKIRHIGKEALKVEKLLYENVSEVLDYLENMGDTIKICTRGEDNPQEEKIKVNGLDKWFPRKNQDYFIVNDKKIKNLEKVIGTSDRRQVFLIDNSIWPIKQALLAGINGVYIPRETWKYEDCKDEKFKEELKGEFIKKGLVFFEFSEILDIKTNYKIIKAPPEQLTFTFSG